MQSDFQILEESHRSRTERDPALFPLGLVSFLARKCILLEWMKETPPTVTLCYREIFGLLPHERMSAALTDDVEPFLKIWKPVLDYLPVELKHAPLRVNTLLSGRKFRQVPYETFLHVSFLDRCIALRSCESCRTDHTHM